MIDVKEAVNEAVQSTSRFYEGHELKDLLLEEVEMSEDGKYWLITIGFDMPHSNQSKNVLMIVLNEHKYIRKYKIFKIDSKSGKVLSMKIREI